MGNKGSRPELKKKDVVGYVSSTRLEPEEIKSLYVQFLSIKSDETEGEEITQTELQRALGYSDRPSRFIERIFALFDSNHDGRVTFPEFLSGVALLSPVGIPKDRVKFSFDIYNASGDGFISKAELASILDATLKENDIVISAAQLRTLVDSTFQQADLNGDERIDFEEYEVMVAKNPSILKPITLNVGEIIANSRAAAAAVAGK